MGIQSLKEDGRPATLWFWGDWFSDHEVQSSSLAAQGLWINMLGIMSRSSIKGALLIGGKKVDGKVLAKRLGKKEDDVVRLLKELERNGVYSKLIDGTIINRRMYGESKLQKIRSDAGKLGAKSRWQNDGKDDNKPLTNENGKPLTSVEDEDENEILKEGEDKSLRKEGGDDPDLKLVQLLIDLMIANNPDSSTIKHLTTERQEEWIRQCRLLRERDGKTPEQIEAIIRFSQADSFWKGNILSMPKLREKWDQLWMKAQKGDHLQGIRDFLNDKQ